MLSASTLYRETLPYAMRRETRVQVYQGGVLVGDSDSLPGLLPVSGQVQAVLDNRVSRTLRYRSDPNLFSPDVEALLSAESSVLKVFTGIGYGDGSREIFPVFTGRIYTAARAADGGMEVEGEDYAADVVGFPFEQPQVSITTNTITEEIRRLILQVLPDAVFGTDDVSDPLTPSLVWDEDRGKALDDLAQAAGGRWYALGDGSFVVRAYPYTAGVPVLSIADASGGTSFTAVRTVTRIGAANSVTVVANRFDGGTPIRVTVRDNVPTSRTFFGGPFGRVGEVLKVQTPLTQGQANQVALDRLAARTALAEQWDVACVPDATLEPGDTIALSYRGVSAVQVIDTITYPLTVQGPMQFHTRSSVPVPVAS